MGLFDLTLMELLRKFPEYVWNQLAWRNPFGWVDFVFHLFVQLAWFPLVIGIILAVASRRLHVRFAGWFARLAFAVVAAEIGGLLILWMLGYWILLLIALVVYTALWLRR